MHVLCSAETAEQRKRSHPTTAVMVKDALTALDSRKGVSSQVLQNYIKQNYPTVDVQRLKHLVRQTLKKGVDRGELMQPLNPKLPTGQTRKYRVRAFLFVCFKELLNVS